MMQKVKLIKLAKFLREYVKPKWFSLETFADEGFDVKRCGTAACALGWTPTVFPRSNFKLKSIPSSSDDHHLYVTYKNSKDFFEGFEAAQKFFGLTKFQVYYLFSPIYYPIDHRERISVTKRIERFVKTDGKCMKLPLKEYW